MISFHLKTKSVLDKSSPEMVYNQMYIPIVFLMNLNRIKPRWQNFYCSYQDALYRPEIVEIMNHNEHIFNPFTFNQTFFEFSQTCDKLKFPSLNCRKEPHHSTTVLFLCRIGDLKKISGFSSVKVIKFHVFIHDIWYFPWFKRTKFFQINTNFCGLVLCENLLKLHIKLIYIQMS